MPAQLSLLSRRRLVSQALNLHLRMQSHNRRLLLEPEQLEHIRQTTSQVSLAAVLLVPSWTTRRQTRKLPGSLQQRWRQLLPHPPRNLQVQRIIPGPRPDPIMSLECRTHQVLALDPTMPTRPSSRERFHGTSSQRRITHQRLSHLARWLHRSNSRRGPWHHQRKLDQTRCRRREAPPAL